jgi:hypothetical protein
LTLIVLVAAFAGRDWDAAEARREEVFYCFGVFFADEGVVWGSEAFD